MERYIVTLIVISDQNIDYTHMIIRSVTVIGIIITHGKERHQKHRVAKPRLIQPSQTPAVVDINIISKMDRRFAHFITPLFHSYPQLSPLFSSFWHGLFIDFTRNWTVFLHISHLILRFSHEFSVELPTTQLLSLHILISVLRPCKNRRFSKYKYQCFIVVYTYLYHLIPAWSHWWWGRVKSKWSSH